LLVQQQKQHKTPQQQQQRQGVAVVLEVLCHGTDPL
jgi:hypothetical protein